MAITDSSIGNNMTCDGFRNIDVYLTTQQSTALIIMYFLLWSCLACMFIVLTSIRWKFRVILLSYQNCALTLQYTWQKTLPLIRTSRFPSTKTVDRHGAKQKRLYCNHVFITKTLNTHFFFQFLLMKHVILVACKAIQTVII